jgi:hypothetical protein
MLLVVIKIQKPGLSNRAQHFAGCSAARSCIPRFLGVWTYLFHSGKSRFLTEPEISGCVPVGQAFRSDGGKQKTPQSLAGPVFFRCVHQSIE